MEFYGLGIAMCFFIFQFFCNILIIAEMSEKAKNKKTTFSIEWKNASNDCKVLAWIFYPWVNIWELIHKS